MLSGEIQLEHKINRQTILESFLSLMIAFLIVTLYLLTLQLFQFQNEEEFFGNTFYFCIAVFFVSGLVYQVLLDLFSETKHRIGLHLRIVIFWVLIITGLCALLKQVYAPYYLIPGLIVEFLFAALFNKVLYYQEKFINQTKDWAEQDLAKNLRSNSLIVETLNKSIDLNKKILLTVSIIIGTATFIGGLNISIKQEPVTITLIIIDEVLYFICVIFLVLIYNIYQRNTYFYFLGFKTAINSKYSLIKTVSIIALFSCFIGLGLSSNKALIKLPTHEIEQNLREREILPPKEMEQPKSQYNIQEDLKEVLGESKENKFAEIFFKILEWILIGAVVIFIAFLLVKYIFTTSFFSFFKPDNLGKIIAEFFKRIEDFFMNLFHLKKEPKQRYATVNSRSFKTQVESFIKKSRKSAAKKQELDRLTKQFMHIIEWGDSKEIKYRNTMAPGEYTALIPHSAAARVGYLYEKALYAEDLLSPEEEKDFFTLTKEILES